MRRKRDENRDREVEKALARLGEGISEPSSDELSALARAAAAGDRPPLHTADRPRIARRWVAASVAVALLVGSGFGFGLGTSLARPALGSASEFGAFVMSGDAIAAPARVSTRSCTPAGPRFIVHIVGKKEGSFWAQPPTHAELFAGIPAGRSFVAVWSFGTQQTRGAVLYAWIAGGKSRHSALCRARTVRAPSRRNLGETIRVRDGWATGGRFECGNRGRVVIQTEELGSAVRMAVWAERSGELLAIAESRPGSAWARVSKRCFERSPL